ncbi:hypothetical protein LOD75_10135 [Xylella fastidiosa subsp. multiplex]|uniref:hypothetical protein n=1 Tax=Xylella fastidiosa TaxID=2371 RepID=UPI001268CBC3|nr:hypothetical protein [Xylella fastidiosa]MDD0910270.1 hypothetical protein [Xylella fastidiosa subsp. multiplex]
MSAGALILIGTQAVEDEEPYYIKVGEKATAECYISLRCSRSDKTFISSFTLNGVNTKYFSYSVKTATHAPRVFVWHRVYWAVLR